MVKIFRHPTALTKYEKLRMIRYEWKCAIYTSNYHDQRMRMMMRCPMSTCQYGIISSRTPRQSIGVHYREHHCSPEEKYRIFYHHKNEEYVYDHPQKEEDMSQETTGAEDPKGKRTGGARMIKPSAERTKRQQFAMGVAKYTQPTIRDATLRNRLRTAEVQSGPLGPPDREEAGSPLAVKNVKDRKVANV